MLGEIQAGKPLKKAPPPEKPAPEGRGGLLAQIQAGKTLKKVPVEDIEKSRASAKEATDGGLQATLEKALGKLNDAVQYSDSEEESEDDDDWD